MDLESFVRSLDHHAFINLLNACLCRVQADLSHIAVNSTVLTEAERLLAKYSRVKAIKCVKERLRLGLKEAKDLVDREVPREDPPVNSY